MTEGAADGIRRVVVVGSGAIGSLVAAVLTIAGSDVTLVSRRRRDSEPHGQLRFEDTRGLSMLGVRRVIEPRAVGATPDLVVVAVKQFDLPAALVSAEAWPGAPLLTVQNGVGAEAVAAAARTSPVLAGSITAAVEPCPDGVRRLRTGGIGLASVRDADATIAWLVPALSAGGLPARVFPDAVAMKWSKLLANLVGNASSALLDMDPGEIYASPAGYELERRQLAEALAVMRGLGVRPVSLPGASVSMLLLGMRFPAVIARPIVARAIGGARGGKAPSLRLHLRPGPGPGTGTGTAAGARTGTTTAATDAGGAGANAEPQTPPGPRTEVAWLNGAVARTGARLGIATPINGALTRLVEAAAADLATTAALAGRPERLLAEVIRGTRDA